MKNTQCEKAVLRAVSQILAHRAILSRAFAADAAAHPDEEKPSHEILQQVPRASGRNGRTTQD